MQKLEILNDDGPIYQFAQKGALSQLQRFLQVIIVNGEGSCHNVGNPLPHNTVQVYVLFWDSSL